MPATSWFLRFSWKSTPRNCSKFWRKAITELTGWATHTYLGRQLAAPGCFALPSRAQPVAAYLKVKTRLTHRVRQWEWTAKESGGAKGQGSQVHVSAGEDDPDSRQLLVCAIRQL